MLVKEKMDDEDIINKLNTIDSRLQNIENILIANRQSAMKMSNHIDFIDGVYDTVKKPFSKILSLCSNTTVEIKDKPKMLEDEEIVDKFV